MSASSSISMSTSSPGDSLGVQPDARPGVYLGAERLRAGLEACGYRCTNVILPGKHSVLPGCTVTMQLGDRIAIDDDGVTCLTLRASIQINGSDERVYGATRWRIRKLFPAPVGTDRLCFAIEADLFLGSDVRLIDVLAHGGDVYRHLHTLICDASATLRDVVRDHNQSAIAPVMRIEARFFGDLAAGRSGLVASFDESGVPLPARATAHHVHVTRAACHLLRDEILPDLASAIRRIALQVQTTIRYRTAAGASTKQTSDVQSPKASPQRHPAPQSAEEGGTMLINATLVPEQAQS